MKIHRNELYNMDCLDLMDKMLPECVDLVVTSPPYDNQRKYDGYNFEVKLVASGLWKILKPGGIIVWVIADSVKNYSESLTSFKHAIFFVETIGFKLVDTMAYEKDGGLPQSDRIRYEQAFEFMFIFSKGRPKTFNPIMRKNIDCGRQKKGAKFLVASERDKFSKAANKKPLVVKEKSVIGNVWKYGTGYRKSATDRIAFNHPAVFPEKLAHDHIASWSNPGDLVYDPMAGSGTVIKAAISLNREWIASEISKEYCRVIKQRLSRLIVIREPRELIETKKRRI
jgi:site-specific DNA-methyltransferase (adenine-specific)